MLVLLIDAFSAVQEVILQAGEQVFGKVGLDFAAIAMLTYLPELLLEDPFVTSITEMNGSLLEPGCRPTDRMDEPASMSVVAFVLAGVIILPGDLTQKRIDNLLSYSGAGMDAWFGH